MKIAPSERAVVRPDPQLPEPRASFGELLGVSRPPGESSPGDLSARMTTPSRPSIVPAGPEDDSESRVAAAAFEAFGMLGRRATTAPFEMTPVSVEGVEPSVSIDGLPVLEAAVQPAVPTPGSASDALPSGEAQRRAARSEVFQPTRSSFQAGDPSAADPLAIPEVTAADEEGAGPAAVRRSVAHRKTAEPETSARLTLSDTADAAGLAVRLAGLSAEEAAQFRARARGLLGEHGLRLEKLDINGEDRSGSDLPKWGITQWR